MCSFSNTARAGRLSEILIGIKRSSILFEIMIKNSRREAKVIFRLCAPTRGTAIKIGFYCEAIKKPVFSTDSVSEDELIPCYHFFLRFARAKRLCRYRLIPFSYNGKSRRSLSGKAFPFGAPLQSHVLYIRSASFHLPDALCRSAGIHTLSFLVFVYIS